VTGGLTALSVQGARNVRALSGKPLELIDQSGVKVLRVAGESTPEPALSRKKPATRTEGGGTADHPDMTREPGDDVTAKTTTEPEHVDNPGGLRKPTGPEVPALPKSWDKFESSTNDSFKARLGAFRGDGNLNPDYSGGEGRVFAADGELTALKRWFKSRLGDMPASLSKLRQVRAELESKPKLSADVDVVKIYEEGPDWILRDFDPNSVELKAGPAEAHAARARAIAELEAQRSSGSLSPMLADLLNKLKRQPPSANLHWSSSKGKIVVIDMQ
jgi:hypothetical protein